ncbi:ABC transporter ATP-binding protein [Halorussus ruber]|uniref:ABC transporter ATP-binding protein n=1 Tax=Halorussus ruber TaxID=1126238 RepID=UPI00109213BA|nr:ABC transporter ATP-binding protein [Halorussus ruber]
MVEFAIQTENLTKRYGDETAVDSLSLTVPSGAVYGLLGPNGAGKTTTLRMLTTLTEPTSGEATVAGVPITNCVGVTERIGYLPAEPPVFEALTGREQLRYAGRLQELPTDVATERIDSLLEQFDLEADADRRISDYSTGMRKKVGIIGTILHEPDVVFLDEPTSGLDPRAARTVREMIKQLTERDTTVVLCSHVLPVVEEIADVVGVIHDGELVAEGTPTEIRSSANSAPDLETAFLDITTDEDEIDSDADTLDYHEKPS